MAAYFRVKSRSSGVWLALVLAASMVAGTMIALRVQEVPEVMPMPLPHSGQLVASSTLPARLPAAPSGSSQLTPFGAVPDAAPAPAAALAAHGAADRPPRRSYQNYPRHSGR